MELNLWALVSLVFWVYNPGNNFAAITWSRIRLSIIQATILAYVTHVIAVCLSDLDVAMSKAVSYFQAQNQITKPY